MGISSAFMPTSMICSNVKWVGDSSAMVSPGPATARSAGFRNLGAAVDHDVRGRQAAAELDCPSCNCRLECRVAQDMA